jgi:thioredoxin-like negative regulator of GroEL
MPQTFIVHRGKIIQDDVIDYMQVVADVEAALSLEGTKRGPSAKVEIPPVQMVKRIGQDAKTSEPTSMVGKTAPTIRLKTLDGNDYDLAKDSAVVVILDFWTTWCGPCRQALPSLQKFHEWTQKTGQPVSLYAVNCGQTDEVVRELWKQKQLSMTVLMDKAGGVADAFNVVALPKTFIIRQGNVVQEDVVTDFDTLVATVERLLPRKDSER